MEDIASGDGDLDVEDVLFGFGGGCKDTHSLKEIADFLREEGKACTGVDIGDLRGHFAGCDVGAEASASIVIRVNHYRLDTVPRSVRFWRGDTRRVQNSRLRTWKP